MYDNSICTSFIETYGYIDRLCIQLSETQTALIPTVCISNSPTNKSNLHYLRDKK